MDELLQLLRQNARASLEELARELNTTPAVVADKISRLEHEGVILGYQAIVDAQKRTAQLVTAVVEVRITPERVAALIGSPIASRNFPRCSRVIS
jgi:DNA-binding Lrp family transcriptional regulator